jgi:hypothetical protein
VVNFAIVGLGWWGKKLAQAIGGSSLTRVIRGIEPNTAAVQEFKATAHIPPLDQPSIIPPGRDGGNRATVTPRTSSTRSASGRSPCMRRPGDRLERGICQEPRHQGAGRHGRHQLGPGVDADSHDRGRNLTDTTSRQYVAHAGTSRATLPLRLFKKLIEISMGGRSCTRAWIVSW